MLAIEHLDFTYEIGCILYPHGVPPPMLADLSVSVDRQALFEHSAIVAVDSMGRLAGAWAFQFTEYEDTKKGTKK